ncbi:hypothetical protein ACRALDRAFT_210260 [Sodiomyces alcalophilus JCM 7366]|uniref:uncharacterized protein n=1 Tax=Sodiomyces alcalophilus JCM 7366 TaxID=591952 RepID=UPI0039B5FDD7
MYLYLLCTYHIMSSVPKPLEHRTLKGACTSYRQFELYGPRLITVLMMVYVAMNPLSASFYSPDINPSRPPSQAH